jgi:hypothetical protein
MFALDLWGMGCVLYFIHYGVHPFREKTDQELLEERRQRQKNERENFDKTQRPLSQILEDGTMIVENRTGILKLELCKFNINRSVRL